MSPITITPPAPSSQQTGMTLLSSRPVLIDVVQSPISPDKLSALSPISGKIGDTHLDGTTDIDTDIGTLAVRLPKNIATTSGQSIQIEISNPPSANAPSTSPGQKPRTITITAQAPRAPAPSQTPPQQQSPAPVSDIYTPSAPPSKQPPAQQIENLNQSTPPIPLKIGTTIPAQAMTIPQAMAQLFEAGQNATQPSDLDLFLIKNILSNIDPTGLLQSKMDQNAGAIENFKSFFKDFFSLKPPAPNESIQTLFETSTTKVQTPSPLNDSPKQFHLTIDEIYQPQGSLIDTLKTLPQATGDTARTSTPFFVIGGTHSNQTIITTIPLDGFDQQNFYILPTRGSPWPTGTILTARISTTPLANFDPIKLPFTSIPISFSVIDDIIDDLMTSDLFPSHTMNAAPSLLTPNVKTPQTLAPAIFFFMAAIRSGDLNGWMGDDIMAALKRNGHTDKIEKLDSILKSIKEKIDSTSTEWRSVQVPLHTSNETIPMMVHFKNPFFQRDENKESSDEKNNANRRIVIDIQFPRMGNIQIDIRWPVGTPCLDTILRTEIPISIRMQEKIETLYAMAMEKTRTTGTIFFQKDFLKIRTLTDQTASFEVLI